MSQTDQKYHTLLFVCLFSELAGSVIFFGQTPLQKDGLEKKARRLVGNLQAFLLASIQYIWTPGQTVLLPQNYN